MGRAGGGAAAQKPGGEKKSLFKRLFTKGIRQRSAGRLVVDGEGSPSRSSDATPSAPATPHGAPGTFVTPPSSPNAAAAAANGPAGSGASPASPNAAAAAANGPASSGAPPASVAGAAAASPAGAASGSGPRCLMVQVIAARKLRAADSNGLSDPYCLVKVWTGLGALRCWNSTVCSRCWYHLAASPIPVAGHALATPARSSQHVHGALPAALAVPARWAPTRRALRRS